MGEGTKLSGQYIKTREGLPLAVFETGNSTGPPLVFLHGFGYSHAVFQPQFESDLTHDFRLIAMDIRGHGYSGKPWMASDYAGSEIWANDLELVLETLSVTDATLVGWSYGAMVCMDWVRKYGSGRAQGFVFIGSHGGLNPYSMEELEAKAKANEDLRKQTPNFEGDKIAAATFIDRMVHAPLSNEMRETLLLSRQMLPHYAVQAMGSRAFENSDLKDTIERPVLFVQGEHDFANSPETIRSVAESLPAARVEILPDVGHVPSIEAPVKFNALVRSFVGERQERWIDHKIR